MILHLRLMLRLPYRSFY